MFYEGIDFDFKVFKVIEQVDDVLGRVRSLIFEFQFFLFIYKMFFNRLEFIK